MLKRIVSVTLLTLISIGILTIAFDIQGTNSLVAEEDAYIPKMVPTVYAGQDIITDKGCVTQFKGYATSADADLIRYEWDFDGDGRFDWSGVEFAGQMAVASYIYNDTGTFYARMRATECYNNLSSTDSVRVFVKDDGEIEASVEEASLEVGVQEPPVADGDKNRYAIMINGGYERRFWNDVTFMFSTLTDDYNFTADSIYLLNYNGKNPDGQNPNGMIDYPATKANLESVFNELSGIVDGDDLLFVWVTNHGRGYLSEMWYGTKYYGYLDGFASVDPGDEQDYLESDFKLRSFCSGGTYACNHGMDVWKVNRNYHSSCNCYNYFRHNYVSSFTDVYFEGPNATLSDDDIFIERLIDYLLGDTDRDGFVETDEGEVYDYDGDGNPPYDHATDTFDEDDWGSVDFYHDITHLATGVPGDNYTIFDNNLDNHVDIDINYDPANLEVDGTDVDNQGLFDGMDVNDDGDMDDWVSIDEMICLYMWGDLRDDEMAAYLSKISAHVIPIFMEQCFSGGFIEDLSGPNRVISTATTEEAVSWGNLFVELFTSALHRATLAGEPVNADSDCNGFISIMEAFNYAAENDYLDEIPQYDDNGDGIGHPYPIPNGGDGDLGAATYLAPPRAVEITYPTYNHYFDGESVYWINGTFIETDLNLTKPLIINHTGFILANSTWNAATYEGTFSFCNNTMLLDGDYTVRVSLTVLAGKTGCDTVHFHIDTTYPVVDIRFPEDNHCFDSEATIWINGTFKEKNFDVSGLATNGTFTCVTHTWNSATYEGTFAFKNNSALADGTHHIMVSLTDLAGKTGSDTVTFTLKSISWEYIFNDERRSTRLRISADEKCFQFIAPDKTFSVKHDPNMMVKDRFIAIHFEDDEIILEATIKLRSPMVGRGFCMAIATDVETGARYFLIDVN